MNRVAGTSLRRPGRMPFLLLSLCLVTSDCGKFLPAGPGERSGQQPSWAGVSTLEFFAQHVFPRESMGGISGLAYDPVHSEWLALSDSRTAPMWWTLGVSLTRGRVEVSTHRSTVVQPPAGMASWSDLEAMLVLPNGHVLIASEGKRVEQVRLPATIWVYDRHGQPISPVSVPDTFVPEAPGETPRGARDNHGFEGMAFHPESSRVWMVVEAPLLQDDELATFDRGARTRMLELTLADGVFRVTRQLVYPIDAVGRDADPPTGSQVMDQGVSELTMLPGGVLVSVERAFVRDPSSGWSTNVIRIFRVDVAEADDVSEVVSLRDAPAARPVRKRLLADLSTFAARLDQRLRALDNFEAAAPGPPTPDGRPTLLLISDDNFSPRQVTAMLVLAPKEP